jgi:protein O-mannosyl-transferase
MARRAPHVDWIAAICLVGATALVYSNSFLGTFQFDDRPTILEDDRLASWRAFAGDAVGMIRPLVKLTFLVDRSLYGDHPAAYHLLNVLLHCGSGLLVFAIVSAAVRRIHTASPSFDWIPFAAALLFLVHPVGTETVTYVSGRATGLSVFLYLLAVRLFIVATGPGKPRRVLFLWHGAALFCFFLALLSKEIAVTLPAVLLLWHVLLDRPHGAGQAERSGSDRAYALRHTDIHTHRPFPLGVHAPYWVLLGLLVVAASLVPRYGELARASLDTRPLYDNLLTQANAVVFALTLFVLPPRLNFDHHLPLHHSLLQWPTPLSIALLGAMGAAAWWSARRAPLISLGLAWFLVCILPTNSVIPRYDVLSERNLYLPSIGIFLVATALVAHATAHLAPARRRSACVAVIGLLVLVSAALGTATYVRNRIYGDEAAFWSDAARKSPLKARPHNNLGHAYLEAGEADRALAHFRTALSLDRDSVTAQRNLRRAWLLKQRDTAPSDGR